MLVALIVVAVLVVFLLIPFSAVIELKGDFDFYFKYLFIKIRPKSSKDSEKSAKKTEKKAKKDSFLKKIFKEKGFADAIILLCDYLSAAFKTLKFLIKRIKIRLFNLDLSVSGSDAADTAIIYGRICSAVYPVLTLLQTNLNVLLDNVNIGTDFNAAKSKLQFKTKFSVQPIVVICAAFVLLFELIKINNKELANYERK